MAKVSKKVSETVYTLELSENEAKVVRLILGACNRKTYQDALKSIMCPEAFPSDYILQYDPIRTGIEILGLFVEAQERQYAVDGTPTQNALIAEKVANRRSNDLSFSNGYQRMDRARTRAARRKALQFT